MIFKGSGRITGWSFILSLLLGLTVSQRLKRIKNLNISELLTNNEGESNKEERIRERGVSGSLYLSFEKNNHFLNIDFRLIQKEPKEEMFKRSLRIKVRLAFNPNKIAHGIYEETYNKKYPKIFSVNIFENSPFQWGVEPRKPIPNIKIKNIGLKAEIDKNGEELTAEGLANLRMEVEVQNDTKGSETSTTILRLNFENEKNTYMTFEGPWVFYYSYVSWAPPLAFLYCIFYFLAILISVPLLALIAIAPIHRDFKIRRYDLMMKRSFYTFYKLQLMSLASMTFIYTSFWFIFVFIFLLVVVELLGPGFMYHISFLLLWGRALQTYTCFDVLYRTVLEFSRRVRRFFLIRQNLGGSSITFLLLLATLVYPSILHHLHWVLVIGALYCSFRAKYYNPCFVDYLSWVSLFVYLVVFYSLYVNCFRAIGYHASFTEPFFQTWKGLVAQQAQSIKYSLYLMIVMIFINFFAMKTSLRAKFCPEKKPELPFSDTISTKIGKHKPGFLNLVHHNSMDMTNNRLEREKVQLSSLSLSGTYSVNKYRSRSITILYYPPFKPGGFYLPSRRLSFKYRDNQEAIYFSRVLFGGLRQPKLIGILRVVWPTHLLFKVFNVRTRMVNFSSIYLANQAMLNDISECFDPVLVWIGGDHRILIFLRNYDKERNRMGLRVVDLGCSRAGKVS